MRRGYSFTTKDGATVSISETNEPDKAILSIAKDGEAKQAAFTKEEFDALMDLRYTVEFQRAETLKAEMPEKEATA